MTYINRFELAMKNLPQLFDADRAPLSILYIGAHHKSFDLVPELKRAGHKITLLELVRKFALRYTLKEFECELFTSIAVGDVRRLDPERLEMLRGEWPKPPTFDVTFWWHGPEHIYEDEVAVVVSNLERITSYLVVLACPWGRTKLESLSDKTPGQKHASRLYLKHFRAMRYNTATMGRPDGRATGSGSTHILAWKWVSGDRKD